MKDMVLNLLSRAEVTRIRFSFGAIQINASFFQSVRNAIAADRIQVVHNPSIGAGLAIYRYTHNTLFLGFRTIAGNTDREALIVHECTHAAFDISGRRMPVQESEAAAYIAQCLYFYYKHEQAFQAGRNPTFRRAILRAAWSIAMQARTQPNLSSDDLQPLLTAIRNDPFYRRRHDRQVPYDGV